MSLNFLETLRRIVDDEWATIKKGLFWRAVMEQTVSRSLYRDLMVQVWHYSRHNSRNQAVCAFVDAPEGLLRFVYRHASEELGHERMAVHDLKTVDLFDEADLAKPPLPATEVLIGYLYAVALRYGPVPRLGYSFWAEGVYEHIADPVRKISRDLQLTSRNMTFFGSHAEADKDHIRQVEDAISKYATEPNQQEHVITVARSTLFLTGQLLEQVALRNMPATVDP